jgi:hypothetical protein
MPAYDQNWVDLTSSRGLLDPRSPDHTFFTPNDLWYKSTSNLSSPQTPQVFFNSNRFQLNLVSTTAAPNFLQASMYPNPFRSFLNPLRCPLQTLLYKIKPNLGNPTNPIFPSPLYYVDSTIMRRADPDTRYGSEPLFSGNGYGALGAGVNGWNSFTSPPVGKTNPSWTGNPPSAGNPAVVAMPPNPWAKLTQEYTASFNDPNRNPTFRYMPLQKIGSSYTTRSNVYAVWITVGLFEVQRIPSNKMTTQTALSNPDGYQLVRELHSDVGGATRNRMFLILDRTIPVAFMRGETINVDKAIRLRRVIQ